MTKSQPTAPAGFTLLELLVAIAIMGLLGAAMAGGVRFGLTAWQAGGEQTEALMDGRSLHGLLRGQLATTPLRLLRGPDRQAVAAFWGEPHRLRFLGRLPQAARPGGDTVLDYERTAAGTLTVSWRALGEEGDDTSDRREVVLTDVAGLRFGYYGRSAGSPVASWHDGWTGRDRLPELVRVEVTAKDDQPWRLPPFVVAIETDLADG